MRPRHPYAFTCHLLPAFLICLFLASPSQAETTVIAELRALTGDTAGNPLEGEFGKSPDDENLPSGFLGMQSRWDIDEWQIDLALLRYPSSEKALALTEAFVRYRPIPDSAWRNQWRAGLFYAPLSLENSEALWQPFGFLSSSAINTWLAEEVRTIGIEWSGEQLGQRSGGNQDFGITLAAFCCNDPAGGLLSWRGWALHDRQFGVDEETEFASLPALVDGGSFQRQTEYGTPLTEIDSRIGYYAGINWRHRSGVQAALMHYDNNGDPHKFENGQWAWYTEFDQFSLRWQPNAEWLVQLQWLDGNTEFGRHIDRKVDNAFSSRFVSVAHQANEHRLSIRIDQFQVDDNDLTPDDDNTEDGDAVTLAWQWNIAKQWQLFTEAMAISSKRPARLYVDESAKQSEHTLQVAARFSW